MNCVLTLFELMQNCSDGLISLILAFFSLQNAKTIVDQLLSLITTVNPCILVSTVSPTLFQSFLNHV